MTDETQAAKIRVNGTEDSVLDTEAALLHAQDDPVASAAVDVAVETELLEDAGALDARRESERQIAELTSKEQERVRGFQRELRTMGADVWPVARWWGYEIHLNESAALLAAEIPHLVGEIAGAVLGSWLVPVIERTVRAKAEWIASIARPYGVKLASPWTAPGMLVPARQSGGDTSLYWTVHEPGDGWSPDQRFVDHFSVSGPALAEFQDRLFLAHRGADGDSALWWTSYDAEEGWSDDQLLPRHFSEAAPALAAYDGRLYCVHRGSRGDTALWWARWDGSYWSSDQRFPQHLSEAAPALAAYDGQLFCVHRGAGSDQALWWTRWDGSTWSPDERLPQHLSASNPALAVYRGHLYCVHRGAGNDTALWWTRWDGSRWSPDQKLPGHHATEGPALTVYKDRLYCVHRGAADQSLWWSSFNGSGWTADERLPHHYSAEGPAIVAYRDKNATHDQLLCVHRGIR
ncbi:hypothetical protein [Nonomuraea gerenzanensis]|uniref:hypothetical protein n=1 Tax=Nonomuraea gerenzanensis TaxID=93944 RepID=UPI001CD93970|nr:hypothetical protein [Nonomuraea gerenzanensis]UBU13063.1 hypothetical protein LCN96_53970 [Nonomuraea gerenzanensis]